MELIENFVHLHGHSCYSLLDGLTKIPNLVEKAAILGHPAIALTDHGVMWGCADLFNECIKYIEMSDNEFETFNKQRIKDNKLPFLSRPKPLLGYEAYYASGMRFPPEAGNTVSKKNYHMVLLARNIIGWRNLSILHFHGYKDGFYRKPRIDMRLFKKHAEGITVLNACMGGYPQQQLLLYKASGDKTYYFSAIKHIELMIEATNNHYYLEVQDTNIERTEKLETYIAKPQRWLADQFLELSKKYNLKIVLTNDFHFLNEDDKKAHAAVCRVGHYKREDGSVYDQNWMKSAKEMAKLYPDHPEWLTNTVEVANECELIDIRADGNAMPICDVPEEFSSESEYLHHLTLKGLSIRYPEGHEYHAEALKRIESELDIINTQGYPGYFLIVYDIYQFAIKNNIPAGLGRGSAAGSCVSYCLGITGLCPIKYNLLFSRFLHDQRISPPDIDADFCASRRQEIIDYIKNKYGNDNVSHIITFQNFKSRQVLRDLGKVHGIDYTLADRMAKSIPISFGNPMPIKEAFEEIDDLKKELANNPTMQVVYDEALKVEGNPKAQSIHAAGIIIAPKKIFDYIPMGWDRKKEIMMTAFDGPTCERLGLMKMDILGIRTLDIYSNAKKDIEKHYEIKINDDDIPLDDARTYEVFRQGMTMGVFQMESGGFREFAQAMEADNIQNIIDMVALYRPGPLGSNMHHHYKARKDGKETVDYYPGCKQFLERTYGLMIYQEQVMQLAQHLCGFTAAESDVLRKAMGKKKIKLLAEQEEKFKNGAKKVGLIDEPSANKLWSDMESFASYAFNVAHSASYGLFAYRTAYLKANFPLYYFKAMLNDRVDDTDRIAQYINEARVLGVKIAHPDINISKTTFEVDSNQIVYGLMAIKGIGKKAADDIIKYREKKGKFKNIQDLCNKVVGVKRSTIVALIKAGCFSKLYNNKSQSLALIEIKKNIEWSVIQHGQKRLDPIKEGIAFRKVSKGGTFKDLIEEIKDPEIGHKEITKQKELYLEYETLGFFLTNSPLKFIMPMLDFYYRKQNIHHLSEAREIAITGKNALFVGVVQQMESKISRSGNPYWIFEIQEDIVLPSIAFSKTKEEIEKIGNGDIVIMLCRSEIKQDDKQEIVQLKINEIRHCKKEEDIIFMINRLEIQQSYYKKRYSSRRRQ